MDDEQPGNDTGRGSDATRDQIWLPLRYDPGFVQHMETGGLTGDRAAPARPVTE